MAPTRRALLSAVGTLGTVGVAGCLGGDTEPPRFGDTTPARTAMLDALADYAREYDVPTLCATVDPPDGERFTVGLGYRDRAGTEPAGPDTLFRIASLSKPLTAATTRHLLEEHGIGIDEPFLEYIDVTPPGGDLADSRLSDATIRHLLNHEGGWDRIATYDPIFEPQRVTDTLGIRPPPTARDYARYLLDRELSFAPGADNEYSNVGYLFLGVLIEDVSGIDFQEYLINTVFENAGIDPQNCQPARTRNAFRPDRETFYRGEWICPDITRPIGRRYVTCPDGAFPVEAMTALGGHVATTQAYSRFMAHYDLTGWPHEGHGPPGVAHGSKRGTRTIAFRPRLELSVVVFTNRRTESPDPLRTAVETGLHEAGI